jgi:2-polyprenyl-3-methyl-5-hydroxy-6-metoxy-1,4-benzoquinol methylase
MEAGTEARAPGLPPELFMERAECISCGSRLLEVLSTGRFGEDPVYAFMSRDLWGESPLPTIGEARWEFVRCRECDQRFHKRVLSPEGQRRYYNDWMTDGAIKEFEELHGMNAPEYLFETSRGHVRHLIRLEWMTRHLRGEDRLRLLDFGCGWGRLLSLAGLLGFEAHGIDRDSDRLLGARDQRVTVHPCLEALDPSLKGRFHAISLFQVLEHLEEPLAILRSLSSWVMSGGILVLEVPNCEGVTGFHKSGDYENIHPLSHVNAFTPATLRRMAERSGFQVIAPAASFVTADPVAVAKTAVKRVIGRLMPSTALYLCRT